MTALTRLLGACEILEFQDLVGTAPSSSSSIQAEAAPTSSSPLSSTHVDSESKIKALTSFRIKKKLKDLVISEIEKNAANERWRKSAQRCWPHPDVLDDETFINSIYNDDNEDDDSDDVSKESKGINTPHGVKRVKLNSKSENKLLRLASSSEVGYSSNDSVLSRKTLQLPPCIKDLARKKGLSHDESSVDDKLVSIINTVFDGLEPFCEAAHDSETAGDSKGSTGRKFNWRHVLKVCKLQQSLQEGCAGQAPIEVTPQLESQLGAMFS